MNNATPVNNTPQVTEKPTPHITIVGAGWAGLTCAYELLKHNFNVTILEAAPQAGGRARRVMFGEYLVDNGQHLLIKGYKHTLSLLKEISTDTMSKFIEKSFEIVAQDKTTIFQFKLYHNKFLPYYLNLLLTLLFSRFFNFYDKIRLLKFLTFFLYKKFQLEQDITVEELLAKYNFSTKIIDTFFKPIVVSTMTTNLEIASAQVFLNILRKTFFDKREYSNLLFSTVDLSTLFVQPISEKIIHYGGKIEYNTRVGTIKPIYSASKNSSIALTTNRHTEIAGDIIVLATPPWKTSKLIENLTELSTLKAELASFTVEPITSVYFEFAAPLILSTEKMVGLVNSYTHWVFNQSAGNPKIACVVISSQNAAYIHTPNTELTKEEIIALVLKEINQICKLPPIVKTKYIQEKHAAFSCTIAANKSRPNKQTAIPNIFIAGDYTAIGYPSTLEAAVLSGKQTSQAILEYYENITIS